MPIIQAESITKNYLVKAENYSVQGIFKPQKTKKCAVDHISFSIEPGEIVGYIGPNGAGKSTTIKMLTGILLPDEGKVTVSGRDPFRYRRQNASNIGVMFGLRSQLWWHLPLEDTLRLLQHMYEIPAEQYNSRIKLLKSVLELDEFWSKPVRQLSLGQRMRGELAAALLHSPSVLYLDEPTVGMDVLVKERIRNLLSEFNQRDGVTVLLTTHDLEDVERLCPRVMLINHGKLCYDGSMTELRSRCKADSTVSIDFADSEPVLPPELRNLQRMGRSVSFSLNRKMGEGALLALVMANNEIRDISITEPPIEDVVRDLYTDGAGK